MVICYLGIGSNLGDRRINIKSAVRKVSELKETKIIKLSKVSETNPIGGPSGQPKFFNAVLKIRTNLQPLILLKKLIQIEKSLGRKQTVRWGPRAIDLDILFYGNKIINMKDLQIPHPRISEREFVLRPLLEVV